MEHTTFTKVLGALDRMHATDPSGRELGYANRMSEKLQILVTAPSEALRIAVCAQHLERWRYPRDAFPMGRNGYLRWRQDAAHRQADAVGELLASLEVEISTTRRIQDLMLKKRLKSDAEAQALEDCACLVFLETELERFADGRDADQLGNILRRTWVKMSEAGRECALSLPLADKHKLLLGTVA